MPPSNCSNSRRRYIRSGPCLFCGMRVTFTATCTAWEWQGWGIKINDNPFFNNTHVLFIQKSIPQVLDSWKTALLSCWLFSASTIATSHWNGQRLQTRRKWNHPRIWWHPAPCQWLGFLPMDATHLHLWHHNAPLICPACLGALPIWAAWLQMRRGTIWKWVNGRWGSPRSSMRLWWWVGQKVLHAQNTGKKMIVSQQV